MKWKLIFLFLVFSFNIDSHAMEVDQFTQRDRYEKTLSDFTKVLNQKTNQLLDLAVSDFNKNCQANLSRKEIHRMLAFKIFRYTGDRHHLDREPHIPKDIELYQALKKLSSSPLESWIVNNESFRNTYVQPIENSVYTGLLPLQYNTNYVIKIKDIFIGPDKIDHFGDEGYSYWIISHYGKNDRTAVDWGVRTENGWFGKKIISIFSFADLRANWMGYLFYKGLFRGVDPLFSITQKGCVKRNRDFDWSRWIDWRFDELQNPCAYDNEWYIKGKTHIKQYLKENLGKYNYCRTYRYTKNKGYFSKPKPRPSDVYLNNEIPTHFENLFDIKYLCE